ncbi:MULTISPECIES: 50S ribosomal protein L9 [Leptospira]|uniref:Large ribosomal subunit protein bL9 n=2 Tax=Leptospira santarosai TaxID=28183 RepID=A0AB73LLF1_9LEPT|nr:MULTISPECIES: 50S ribosomal protein L9 [Leptospira]ASV10772.1 50S ribosomal protein L9 [Leptospira santarosai]AVV48748.1 50S ribosomal protein L9 [Leptospira santarosai]AVV78629.1 50S ribosomal protein L9 [Leptospira santarosai]EKT85554.1 50S ribosomal protein L9 [Leptospira santarosai serovar Shermani str. LT 821]KXZ31707.1 50S ribosomal protein L9 [Leptospira santarosai]
MRVILQKDVINLGDAGDLKEVADGYARNFLFPKRLAVRANEGNTKAAFHQRKLGELKKEKRKKAMETVATNLNGKEYDILVKTGGGEKLFGAVTPIDVASVLKKNGFELDKRKIEIADPIRNLGSYKIKIRLAEGIQPVITLHVKKEEE